MKNRIFVILAFVFVWMGCDEREIPVYDTGSFISSLKMRRLIRQFSRLYIIRVTNIMIARSNENSWRNCKTGFNV